MNENNEKPVHWCSACRSVWADSEHGWYYLSMTSGPSDNKLCPRCDAPIPATPDAMLVQIVDIRQAREMIVQRDNLISLLHEEINRLTHEIGKHIMEIGRLREENEELGKRKKNRKMWMT